MSYFETVIRPIIATATHINYYQQINTFIVLDHDKVLLRLFTTKDPIELARQYNLPINVFKRSKIYYQFKLKLKIEWN